jgi:hypothetical protein
MDRSEAAEAAVKEDREPVGVEHPFRPLMLYIHVKPV